MRYCAVLYDIYITANSYKNATVIFLCYYFSSLYFIFRGKLTNVLIYNSKYSTSNVLTLSRAARDNAAKQQNIDRMLHV